MPVHLLFLHTLGAYSLMLTQACDRIRSGTQQLHITVGSKRERCELRPVAVCFASCSSPDRAKLRSKTAPERTGWVINFGEELRAAIDAVDPQLHHFFNLVVNSFIRLEMVVLFRRAPEAELTPADIARELGWPEEQVTKELRYLEECKVLESSGDDRVRKFRLSSDPRVADLVNKFGFLYANRSSRLLILGHLLREGHRG